MTPAQSAIRLRWKQEVLSQRLRGACNGRVERIERNPYWNSVVFLLKLTRIENHARR